MRDLLGFKKRSRAKLERVGEVMSADIQRVLAIEENTEATRKNTEAARAVIEALERLPPMMNFPQTGEGA